MTKGDGRKLFRANGKRLQAEACLESTAHISEGSDYRDEAVKLISEARNILSDICSGVIKRGEK